MTVATDASRVLAAFIDGNPRAGQRHKLNVVAHAEALLRSGLWDTDELCAVAREFGALHIPGDQFARWATRRQRGAIRAWWTD
jgi:hypothetical protein